MNKSIKTRQALEINPIGYVQVSEGEGVYNVEVLPEYREALQQLDQFSHVIILWWADKLDIPDYRSILTTQLPYAPGIQAGVFACRSEYRPNPIAVTIMPILALDQTLGILSLPWIDAFDGTPVLDLKPYIPVSDRVRDAAVPEWMRDWPEWMEEAGEFFAEHPVDFGD